MAPFHPLLLDLYKAWDAVPGEWALIGLCVYCACTFQELRRNFLAHFWTTLLYGFGGGLSTALLMMRPDRAPISILSDPQLGLMWAAVWWVMNYFPYQIPYKIHSLWPVKMVTLACIAYCKDKLIVDRVNLACELYPGTIFGPVLLGTLAGCGGTLITDSIRHAQGIQGKPHELNVPSFSWRSSFLAAAFYFFSAKFPATSFLMPEEATALLLTLLVSHVLLSGVTGAELDWTQPLVNTALTLLNIPVPGTSSAAKPQPAAKPQVKATAAAPEAAKPVTARPAQQQQQVAQKLAAKPAQNGTSVAPAQNSKPAAVDVKASSVAAAGIETTAKQQGKAEAAAPAVAANGKKAKKEKLVAQPGWTLVTSTKKKA